jgi:hypothetical protein
MLHEKDTVKFKIKPGAAEYQVPQKKETSFEPKESPPLPKIENSVSPSKHQEQGQNVNEQKA